MRVGIIDIGSSTATLALYEGGAGGFVDRIDQVGQPLRLMRALNGGRNLSRDGIQRTVDCMRGFGRKAEAFGVHRLDAFATSAVRDAANKETLVDAIRGATGIELRVITGEEEARAAVLSAVNTLPVEDGLVVDLGGGSLQLARVHGRRARDAVSLPLGSLRITDAFLRTDPPTGPEMVAARRHAEAALRGIGWLHELDAGSLVGIGGTIRALAKMERRRRAWPILHGHGFRLSADDVLASVETLSRQPSSSRGATPGLASHRVETIVAGGVVVAALLRVSRIEEMLVSTYGLREGFASAALHGEGAIRDVREAGLRGRFPSPGGAARRASEAAIHLFDRRERRLHLDAHDRAGLAAATWVRASGSKEPEHLLHEPIQGHTQREILTAARLLELVPGAPPEGLRELLDEALSTQSP